MQDFNLEVNNRIEVLFDKKAYKALIIDVQDDSLRINLPVNEGQYLIAHINEKLEIDIYLDQNKCFKFYCKINSIGREGNIVYYELSKPFDIQKIQRRNYFRANLLNTIKYKIITNIEEEEIDSVPYKEGDMIELSGGGLKLKVNNDIKKGDLLFIDMVLKEQEIQLKCDVVRVESITKKEKICSMKFLNTTQKQIDIIVQGLFEVVRKQIARI